MGQEEHDLAILHLRSPMLNGSNRRTTTKDDDDDDDDNGEERNMAVLDSYQLLMPRYSFNGNERKQHFFLDVMDSTNTTDVESKSKEEEEEEEVHDACHDETKYNDNNNDDNNRKSEKKKEVHDACHDETKYNDKDGNNNQRRRRGKNKKSTISKQNHLQFTLNYKPEISLVNENDHHLPENNFWNTTIKKQHFKNNEKKKKKINQLLSFNNLTIDTSININLDEERFFKEANRFNTRLRPQKLDFGYVETFIQQFVEDDNKKCEQLSNEILNEISNRSSSNSSNSSSSSSSSNISQQFIESKIDEKEQGDLLLHEEENRSNDDEEEEDVIIIVDEMEDINYDYLHGEDEAYPGQRELFEEMRLMEIRRIEQEKEIQRLIINAKRHAENEVKNICLYLQNQLQATQLALEEAERQRAELLARNINKKKKKKKKKREPPWLRLYKESEKRMNRSKQRSKIIKRASSHHTP